jgi:hypothetical protein
MMWMIHEADCPVWYLKSEFIDQDCPPSPVPSLVIHCWSSAVPFAHSADYSGGLLRPDCSSNRKAHFAYHFTALSWPFETELAVPLLPPERSLSRPTSR